MFLSTWQEGICVSMPLYYATGSKSKAIFWSFLSGILSFTIIHKTQWTHLCIVVVFVVVLGVSEPLGALACYLIFIKGFSTMIYGSLFGMISGMMVYITLKELIPTAHKYDTSDRLVSPLIFTGMAVMALSLLAFEYGA